MKSRRKYKHCISNKSLYYSAQLHNEDNKLLKLSQNPICGFAHLEDDFMGIRSIGASYIAFIQTIWHRRSLCVVTRHISSPGQSLPHFLMGHFPTSVCYIICALLLHHHHHPRHSWCPISLIKCLSLLILFHWMVEKGERVRTGLTKDMPQDGALDRSHGCALREGERAVQGWRDELWFCLESSSTIYPLIFSLFNLWLLLLDGGFVPNCMRIRSRRLSLWNYRFVILHLLAFRFVVIIPPIWFTNLFY